MTAKLIRPDLPKRLAGRIRGAQERVRQKRFSIVYAEKNYEQSKARVEKYEADPVAFAAENFGKHGWDSYPVQTNLASNRERNEYHERRRDERVQELAELEWRLLLVESQVLMEVSMMRPSTGRVAWPRASPPMKIFRNELETRLRQHAEKLRHERAKEDAAFERIRAEEEAAIAEESERQDEQLRRDLAAMSPAEYALYRAQGDYLIAGLRAGTVTMQDIINLCRDEPKI